LYAQTSIELKGNTTREMDQMTDEELRGVILGGGEDASEALTYLISKAKEEGKKEGKEEAEREQEAAKEKAPEEDKETHARYRMWRTERIQMQRIVASTCRESAWTLSI
jgi:hypothetical protein